MKTLLLLPAFIALCICSASAELPLSPDSAAAAFAGRSGACIVLDCASEDAFRYRPELLTQRLTPCSTFKIWNTLIALECGLLSAADEPFYRWDGEKRFLADWNRDLTLKEAFRVSCVPAFQQLAITIGAERMQLWIDSLGYGDRDLSSGIDIFWLPRDGKKSILISPEEQALLLRRMVKGELPFSNASLGVLKQIMLVKETDRGRYYGKTGTGNGIYGDSKQDLGWFVGFVESGSLRCSFACILGGTAVTGRDARDIVEKILVGAGLL